MDDRALARIIVRRMMAAFGVDSQAKLATKLGIKPPSVTSAINAGRIPAAWFETAERATGTAREEFTRQPEQEGEDLGIIRSGLATNEDSLPMVRNYRELARMDADTLGEIQTWLNDMERWRPGFTGWFRLEFQNRFPEFDEWKQRVIKKSVGAGD